MARPPGDRPVTYRRRAAFGALVLAFGAMFWARGRPGTPVRLVVPAGATLSEVADSLSARHVIRSPALFQIYARVRRADRKLKAGTYDLETGTSWRVVLRQVTRGEVVTVPMTIPEGYRLSQMAGPIAAITGESVEGVKEMLGAPGLAQRLNLPGPSIEGYVFPDTYRFAQGVPVTVVVDAMVARYRKVWTPERVALLEEIGMSEREVVTLASIIQAEARRVEEMPRISGVFHNRLQAGWRLEADPTVLYALGGHRERLLFAAIDSVRDNPYNTYSNPHLPPGPIGSPGERAIDAALAPDDHDFMYFVAWPDGSHIFTRSLAEHNAARADAGRAREAARVTS